MDRNECSSLDFQLGTTGVEATIPTRQWNIKVHREVNLLNTALLNWYYIQILIDITYTNPISNYSQVTQIECSSELRAPQGCTQYLYGSDTNTVRSFNFDNGDGIHLGK